MNPDIAKAFNILRNLVPSKGKLIHSHDGYRVYDLENIRVDLDADGDTVNRLDEKALLSWTIGSSPDELPKVIYNLPRLTTEDMLQFAEEFAARHTDKRS